MDHPKEEKINQWLKSNPNPTFKMIKDWSDDFETMVMTMTLADIPLNTDLKEYCQGITLADRVNRYKPYPLWFKTFIPQDISSAIELFKLDRDSEGYGQNIIDDWKDDDAYLNMLNQAHPYEDNSFKMTFKNVILNDAKSSEGLVTDHNISEEFQSRIEKRDKIDFESDFVGDLFYFLQLDEHAEMSQADLNDLSKYAEKIEDFICSNVDAIGRISDKDVLLNIISDLFLLFDKEPNIKLDKEKFKKEFVKEVKDLGLEFLEDEAENLSAEIAALVGGRSVTLAKIAYQIFKKGMAAKSVFDESVDVTFDEDDEQDFYDRFASSHSLGDSNIRQFFIEEISIPLKRLFIKKRMDTGLLTDQFFNNQYKTFINSRFYSKVSMLSHEESLKLSQIVDKDEKDTLLFILLSKRKFNKYTSFFK